MCVCLHKPMYNAFSYPYACMLPCSYFSISCRVICQDPKRTDWLNRCAGNTTISIITYRKNIPCKNQFTPLTNVIVKRLRQTQWAAGSGCTSPQLNDKMFQCSSKRVHKLISLHSTSFFQVIIHRIFICIYVILQLCITKTPCSSFSV